MHLVLKLRKERGLGWSQNLRGTDVGQFCFKPDLVLAVSGYSKCIPPPPPPGAQATWGPGDPVTPGCTGHREQRSGVSLRKPKKKKKREAQSKGVVSLEFPG